MRMRMLACSLAATVLLCGTTGARAESGYPDLTGTWVGKTTSLTRGRTDHYDQARNDEPVFREASWTLTVDHQEGNRFTAERGLTEGKRRDPIVGIIRADRKSVLMVDDDGTFYGTINGPDAMEVCRTEVTPADQIVSCAEYSRKK
ncbi:MAG: hypothetical protein U1E45_13600 [Geminicoccaceae bacterium]